jgi:hypothetical protein
MLTVGTLAMSLEAAMAVVFLVRTGSFVSVMCLWIISRLPVLNIAGVWSVGLRALYTSDLVM